MKGATDEKATSIAMIIFIVVAILHVVAHLSD
jgi:hypothetical protein